MERNEKKEITIQAFMNILEGHSDVDVSEYYKNVNDNEVNIIIENLDITGYEISSMNIIAMYPCIIKNCTFKEGLLIKSLIQWKGLSIEKCIFEDLVVIENSNNIKGDLIIDNTTIKGSLALYKGNYANNFIFRSVAIEGDFAIYDIKCSKFIFNDSTCGGNFHIYNPVFDIISFRRSVFKMLVNIVNPKINDQFGIYSCKRVNCLQILGGEFNNFFLRDSDFPEGIGFYGGIFNQKVALINLVLWGSIDISNGIFNKDFLITGGEYKELRVDGGVFEGKFILEYGTFYLVNLISLHPGLMFLSETQVYIGAIRFKNILTKDTFIKINSECRQIYFHEFINFGNIFFLHIHNENFSMTALKSEDKETKKIQMFGSDLGKTTFINCDLRDYNFDFFSSKITEIFLSGTKMPSSIEVKDNEQKQFGYSQIKKIYEARGDKVEANRYFAKEMEAYRSKLDGKKNSERWEKLNLWLNKISTNYGQSWERGLATTLLISLCLYFVYCICLGIYPAFFAFFIKADSVDFIKVTSYFLEFINPIHKADYIAIELLGEGEKVNSWARWVEGISRIFIAYFLYQLIQAFRKHGKSSS